MNEILDYLKKIGVKQIRIEPMHGETCLYFKLYDVGFSPIIPINLTVDEFKQIIKYQYKKTLENMLIAAECDVAMLNTKLLINF